MIVTLMCANLIIRKIYKDGSPSVKVALSQHYNGSERPCKRFLRVRIYKYHKETEAREYDSVRGVFIEGREAYPGAGFKEKTHIQLCIVNPNCIKGFFSPRCADDTYLIP